jgi:hypothetical protein
MFDRLRDLAVVVDDHDIGSFPLARRTGLIRALVVELRYRQIARKPAMRHFLLTGLLACVLILGSLSEVKADERLLQAHRLCIEYFEKLFDLEGHLDLPAVGKKELDENEFWFSWFNVLENIRIGDTSGPFHLSCGGYYDKMEIVMIGINGEYYFNDEIPQP